MNLTGFLACIVVSLNCIHYASGDQTVFSESALWVWWIIAGIWGMQAIMFAVKGLTES